MKYLIGLIVACAITIGASNNVSAQCCDGPVRKVVRATAAVPVKMVKATVCLPVKTVRAWKKVKPIRRAVTLPARTVRALRCNCGC